MSDIGHAFQFIGDHPGFLLGRTAAQIGIFAIPFVLANLAGGALGVWLGHIHKGSFIAINVSNVGRALPSLAIIAMAVAIIGLGTFPLIIALFILVFPVVLTNCYVAVDSVDRDVVDAARGIGFTELEILRQVEIPLALPLIFAGVRTGGLYNIATVPLGAVVGTTGGLGDVIANQASYRLAGVIGASICIAVLAFALDFLLSALQRILTPTGLRVAPGREESVAVTTQQARSAVTA